MSTKLLGMLEKPRFIQFLKFIDQFDATNPKTMEGVDPRRHTMEQIYQKFGLQDLAIEFMGHAVALETSDDYMKRACGPTIEKMQLYKESLNQIGDSPFIYPLYGLGGLPEGFSRLSAINRGTYMLNKPFSSIVFDDAGKVCGVKCTADDGVTQEVAKCKMVICDPSYAPEAKSRKLHQIIRSICILGKPIPNTFKKDGQPACSCQIIMPQKQFKPPRKNDIFIMMVSWAHHIAAEGKYVAIVSTIVETGNPEKELEPALKLLGPILERFTSISDYKVPVDDGVADQVFVTASYDDCSHFGDADAEVKRMWKTITGEDLDMTVPPDADDD
jgi:Rab GDP dissociation inhibitor